MEKLKAFYSRMVTTENGEIELTFAAKGGDVFLAKNTAKNLKAKAKKLSIEIKDDRAHRSLNANAYLWTILEQMAQALETDKDSLYLLMLERYGVFTHIIVKPDAVERWTNEFRTVKVLGEMMLNGKIGVQVQCYYGSSTYDTKEMSRLLNGVVEEAKDLGIDTMTPTQIEQIVAAYNAGVKNEVNTAE